MAGEGGTQEVKITPIELGRYDKIREVYIAYRDSKIQGIAFGVTDAIGSRKIISYGIKHYNYAMMLKPNEYIMKLSGTYTVNEARTQSTIVSLKIHTNLCPNGLPKSDDDDEDGIFKAPKDIKTDSFLVELSETDIIVQVFLTAYQDANKKGAGYESFLLSSIGLEIEEVIYNDMKYGLPAKYVDRKEWSLKLGKCEYIKEIIISYEEGVVNGIGFVKVDAFGRRQPLEWFGGYGVETYRMVLKPKEYIARISGTYNKNYKQGEEVIAALRIHTNQWLSGYKLCGSEPSSDEQYFSTPLLTTDCIQEIYGSCSPYHLTSLAITVKECVVKDGPFGSHITDNEWSIELDANENIKKIRVIFVGALLNSIEITTSTSNTLGMDTEDVTQKAGGSGGNITEKTIDLKNGEYITKISGSIGTCNADHGDVRGVANLAIHTNQNPTGYGHYGVVSTNTSDFTGFEISLPEDARIVRLFGTTVEHQVIQSIGVDFSQKEKDDVKTDGPHGNYQKEWFLPSDNIREMIVMAGEFVHSLETIARTPAGREARTDPHKVGGDDGSIHKIEFKEGEYITKISGATGTWKREIKEGGDVRVVARLAIHTNLKPDGYGPFGGDDRSKIADYIDFSSVELSNDVRVIRFFGTIFDGQYIQSIGVLFNQKQLRRGFIGINTQDSKQAPPAHTELDS